MIDLVNIFFTEKNILFSQENKKSFLKKTSIQKGKLKIDKVGNLCYLGLANKLRQGQGTDHSHFVG